MPEYFISYPNKKSRQLLNKKYRQFKTDLWGTLFQSARVTTLMKVIIGLTYQDVQTRLGSSTQNTNILTSSFMEIYNHELLAKYIDYLQTKFPYDVSNLSGKAPSAHSKLPPKVSLRSTRRQFTLFYGANKMRIPAFQKYIKKRSLYNFTFVLHRPNKPILIVGHGSNVHYLA